MNGWDPPPMVASLLARSLPGIVPEEGVGVRRGVGTCQATWKPFATTVLSAPGMRWGEREIALDGGGKSERSSSEEQLRDCRSTCRCRATFGREWPGKELQLRGRRTTRLIWRRRWTWLKSIASWNIQACGRELLRCVIVLCVGGTCRGAERRWRCKSAQRKSRIKGRGSLGHGVYFGKSFVFLPIFEKIPARVLAPAAPLFCPWVLCFGSSALAVKNVAGRDEHELLAVQARRTTMLGFTQELNLRWRQRAAPMYALH